VSAILRFPKPWTIGSGVTTLSSPVPIQRVPAKW
jgi:hypothetical protein